jgi:hypothetical protein
MLRGCMDVWVPGFGDVEMWIPGSDVDVWIYDACGYVED